MQRLFFSSISIFFGFMMVVVSAVATGQEQNGGSPQLINTLQSNISSDQLDSSRSADQVEEEMVQENENTISDYYLAYPGVLPDHPLYPLKMIRDRIRLWIANTPEKKIELMRLYADKRLGAGKALIEGGKTDLGVDTVVKSHGYILRVLGEAKLSSASYDYSEIKSQLEFHIQTVEQLIQQLEGQDLSRLEQVLEESNESYGFVLTTFEKSNESSSHEEKPRADIDEDLRPAEFGR